MAAKPDKDLVVVAPLPVVARKPRSTLEPQQRRKKGDEITKQRAFDLINGSIDRFRYLNDVQKLIRELSKREGPFSSAVHSLVSIANCGHLITAFDSRTHEFSPEGSHLASAIISAMDTLYDFTGTFSNKKSIESLKYHMLREACLTGGLAVELVLTDGYVPDYLQVPAFETLTLKSDGKGGCFPSQKGFDGDDIDLNIPNFFMAMMQHDADSYYPFSMMESALKLIVYFEEFMEDIRRSVRQNGHTRTVVEIDTAAVTAAAPPSVRNNEKKLKEWMEEIRSFVKSELERLEPDDTLVMFNTAKLRHEQAGLGSKVDYTPLLTTLSGMYATSMKTPPSAIGMRIEGGSQALGNIESLIFLKTASSLQTPVEDVLSRALTLGCRLYGMEVYVKFEFDKIDLRPETELEAFYVMRQTRILEQLSLGFISDEYAAHLMRTGKRPAGAPALSGTMFSQNTAQPNTAPGDTAMGRTLQPSKDSPRKGGGKSQ